MSVSRTSHGLDVSHKLLTGVADALEETNRLRGGFNHFVARYAGDACRLLGFTEQEQRFQNLLRMLTPQLYWAGAFTNFDTTGIPEGARELSPIEQIEQKHPLFSEDYPLFILRKMGGCLSICARRDYDLAFAQAETELEKEEIILAQVLMGDYGLAADSLPRLLEEDRKQNVILVSIIELYRNGRISEAEEYRGQLSPGSLTDWGGAQLAIGASNRVPWEIYPFPDY